MALTLNYATKAQLGAELRARLQTATMLKALKLCKVLHTFIQDGDFSDAELMALFGIGPVALVVLKNSVQNKANLYDQVQSAVGE